MKYPLSLRREGAGSEVPLLAEGARRQRPYNRVRAKRTILFAAWHPLAHEVRGCAGQLVHRQVHVAAKAVVERQLEVGRLAKGAVGADLHAVAAEDAAIQGEIPAH